LKQPAMQFYVGDWLRDVAPLTAAECGAWINVLCYLHDREPRGEATHTLERWAQIMHVEDAQAADLIGRLAETEVANVFGPDGQALRGRYACNALRNALVTPRNAAENGRCNAGITLVSRRMVRERKKLSSNALRQRRHRDRRKDVTPRNADQNGESNAPSSSSSSSSSIQALPEALRGAGDRDLSGTGSEPNAWTLAAGWSALLQVESRTRTDQQQEDDDAALYEAAKECIAGRLGKAGSNVLTILAREIGAREPPADRPLGMFLAEVGKLRQANRKRCAPKTR